MYSDKFVEIENISKSFPGVQALSNITFSINKGEILAIVGENGAGKSTLVRIIAGVFPNSSYSGNFSINGDTKKFKSPKDAQDAGIAMIHQELMLVKDLSVAENIFLGNWPINHTGVDWPKMNFEAKKILEKLGLSINPKMNIAKLGVSQLQLIEIAKALVQDRKILILDEPTAALTEVETNQLFSILDRLKKENVTIIYISHRLKEIFSIADRIAVLRDGQLIGIDENKNLSYQKVVSMMIGRELTKFFPENQNNFQDTVLEIQNCYAGSPESRTRVKNVSFKIRKGEILGLAGLLGSGRTDLALTIFGAYKGLQSKDTFLEGRKIKISKPSDAIKNGIALLTENRKETGIIDEFSLSKNLTLSILDKITLRGFYLFRKREIAIVRKYMKDLRIKATSPTSPITSLSGGNQQKVLISRWLATNPKVLILDEPTRGIDVNAKAEIYQIMRDLTSQGIGILMISSDLIEVLEVSDRILVMCEGCITGEFSKDEATEESLMACATGTNRILN